MPAVTYTTHGLVLTEHEFSLPLDHDRPGGEPITVFAREVADPGGRDRPFLVFLQGGPGFEAPRPTRHPSSPGWLDRALQDFRVLMLDQRGTGRSTPVGALPGLSAAEQADYLKHFRADSIVRDAEPIRAALGVERWSVLGQSFGGFCVMTYLSLAPEGLREAFVTGGLPPVGRPVDEVYRATYERILERNRRYYERYPEDRARVRALVERLDAEPLILPTGDRLTARRFRQAGNKLGMSDGAEELHSLLELPARLAGVPPRRAGPPRLRAQPDLRDPARGLLRRRRRHALVGGAGHAGRVRATRRSCFTGEHVFPWMFEDYGALAPLREAAELLAAHEWPRLYDAERLARERGPGRGGDLRRRPLRRAGLLRGDRRAHPRRARLGHQRVRAQRPARRRRPHPRPPDRPRARARLTRAGATSRSARSLRAGPRPRCP